MKFIRSWSTPRQAVPCRRFRIGQIGCGRHGVLKEHRNDRPHADAIQLMLNVDDLSPVPAGFADEFVRSVPVVVDNLGLQTPAFIKASLEYC
jgi:hypothetical protein